MEILHTIEVPERGDHKVSAASGELAITRLYERLRDEADEGEKLIQITPAMITERESHFGMDEFYARYRFIKNPASEGTGKPFECMFETRGGELAFVHRQPPERIWTLLRKTVCYGSRQVMGLSTASATSLLKKHGKARKKSTSTVIDTDCSIR